MKIDAEKRLGAIVGVVVIASSLSLSLANLTGSLRIIDVGGTPIHVSVSVTLYNLFYTFMSLYWTRILYGHFSRREIIVIALSGLAFGLLLMAFANNVWLIIAASSLIGLFGAILSPLLTSLLTDYFGRDSIAVTKYNIFSSLGLIVGYLSAGLLRTFVGLPEILLITSIIAASSAPLAYLIPFKYIAIEPRKSSYISPVPHFTGRLRPIPSILLSPRIAYNMGKLARDFRKMLIRKFLRQLPLTLIATGIFFTGVALFFSMLPVFLRELGFNDSILYFLYMYSTIVTFFSYTLVRSRVQDRNQAWNSLKKVVLLRVFIFLLPYTFMLLENRGINILLLLSALFFTLIGVTWAYITVSLPVIILSISEVERRDERLGHLNASIGSGMIIGSSLSGPIVHAVGYVGIMALPSILSLLSYMIYSKAEEALVT